MADAGKDALSAAKRDGAFPAAPFHSANALPQKGALLVWKAIKNPAFRAGFVYAKENNYLRVTNTPGPMVELSEMLCT